MGTVELRMLFQFWISVLATVAQASSDCDESLGRRLPHTARSLGCQFYLFGDRGR